jgi:hypothetical protein
MDAPLESILRDRGIFRINVARRDAKNLFATISARNGRANRIGVWLLSGAEPT